MSISREEVEHVARLARLDLTEQEVELFRGQLSAVLDRAKRIQALDLDDVPPTGHPGQLSNVLRPDLVELFDDTQSIIAAAPQAEESFFRVPAILDGEG